jgi:PAS domain S-box-containing protein
VRPESELTQATEGTAGLPDPALPPPPWAARIPRWAWLVVFALAHLALRDAGHRLFDRPGGFALVWPPTGLVVYALLVARRRTWPAVLALTLATGVLGSLQFGRPLGVGLALNAANLAQAIAAWWIVVRIGGRPTLRTLRGALVLMFAPAAALAAVSAASHLVLAASAPRTDQQRFWGFWGGSSLGILLVTSVLVAWTTPARSLVDARRAGIQAAGIAVAFAAALLLLRARGVVEDEIVLLPPLLWAAFRFGPRGATTAVILGGLAVFATGDLGGGIAGHGGGAEGSALTLQLFLALGAGSIIAVAAVAEERRSADERRVVLERAFDHTPDPAGVFEEDGSVVWVNEAMARELAVPRDALVGRRIWELPLGSSGEAWRERWDRVAARGSALVEEVAPGPGGRLVPWEISAALVNLEGRKLMVSVLRDLSDRRRAEEASRLAALGTLAAGVAHEINNPLAYVVANIAHVRDGMGPLARAVPPEALRAEVLDPLAEAEEGARRVRDIVRQLRAFARPDEQVGPVYPARALRAALAMAQNELRHRARVVADVADTPPVTGSENRLVQVFVNLLVNAAQAIPEGNVAENEVRAALRVEGDEIVAEISDTGAGMTPETRARVFEPFFTTKGPGAGVGLGLAISHSILTGMGGRIDVESKAGSGSRFRVVLPAARGRTSRPPEWPATLAASVAPAVAAAPAVAPAPGPASAAAPVIEARRRLLVVDDEPLVSRALARILEPEGEVVVADRARDALERVRAGERFDAIVCDLMMPDLSGMELHAALLALDPAVADRMVFVTGGAFTDAARTFLERVPNPRLEKPLDRAALRDAVRCMR